MTVWPILERELRRASRKPATWLGRFMAAFLVCVFGIWLFWVFHLTGGASFGGKLIFTSVTSLMFAQCLLSGASRTADCLSEEKREGTLGLLFLTDLKPRDIVLGKLFAKALGSIYGLLGTFPIVAIAIFAGGIGPAEFWRSMCSLLSTLIFSMTVGMFISSHSVRQRLAMSFSAGLILLFTLGLPALAEFCRRIGSEPHLTLALDMLSPVYAQRMAVDSARGLSTNYFWISILMTQTCSWLLLRGAWNHLPKTFREEQTSRKPRSLRRWVIGGYGGARARASFRRRALTVNPFFWLTSRDHLRRWWPWVFLLVVIGALAVFWNASGAEPMALSILAILLLALLTKVWMVSAACDHLGQQRQDGGLELLLSTPITVQTILHGQWRSLHRRLTPIVLATMVIGWVTLDLAVTQQPEDEFRLLAGFQFVSLLEIAALGWTGMWMALRIKEQSHASGAAFFRIILLPYLGLGVTMTALNLAKFWRNQEEPSFQFVFCLWAALSIVNSVAFSLSSRRKLYREFRVAATDRFQPKRHKMQEWILALRMKRGPNKLDRARPENLFSVHGD